MLNAATPTGAGADRGDLSAAGVATMAGRLTAAGDDLRRVPLAERIAAVDRTAARWLASDSPWRREALTSLPARTGHPPDAIAAALDHLWQALRAPELATQARVEAEALARVDARLAVHVLAGNVPGAGVFGIVAALLAGVPSLVKTAGREPLLPTLVAASLAAEDARLGAAVAALHWDAADTAATDAAIAAADVVLGYGRQETLEAIATRRPRRLLRFGPRMSLAVIARDAVGRSAARDLAWQTALFDQQGCLSPQLVIVEETARSATTRFLETLADELGRLAVELPSAPRLLVETAAIARYLERQRWRAQEGADLILHEDTSRGAFSVACDRTGQPLASPLWRHLTVLPVPALSGAHAVVAAYDGMVEAIGFSGPHRRLDDAAALAVACSAARLCPLERMQAPPFGWRQSGHARLGCFARACLDHDRGAPRSA